MRRSSRSAAISSSTGATTRQGPHQAAQKSTSTGLSDSSTSAWKLVSVTLVRLPAKEVSPGSFGSAGKVLPGTIQSVVLQFTPPLHGRFTYIREAARSRCGHTEVGVAAVHKDT